MRCLLCSVVAIVALASAHVVIADEVTLLDGRKLDAKIVAIDAAGKVTGENIPEGLELDAVRKVDKTASEVAAKAAVSLELMGGGRIAGESITIENEKFHVAWALGDKLVLPIDVVRAVRFDPSASDPIFEEALVKPSSDNDRLFVKIDDKLTILTGLIETLTAENVVFQYEGAQQTLATDKLFGIVVAQATKPSKSTSGVTIELADGSRIAGEVKSLAGGQLAVTVGPSNFSVPWSAVKSMSVRSSRLAFLSDLDPAEIEEYPLVTPPQPWQRDKNVQRKTLTLGERKFDRGLGTHSYSKLVFEIGGAYDVFSSVIGIDASTERKGDCVFVVLGDGKELARERMTGATEAKELQLDIAGVNQLTLIVEPGEDLDLADIANWADARVIKKK